MKFLVAYDHFVRKEHYEELFKSYPEHTLVTVPYGTEDRIEMRDMFREVEENGPDAVAIPQKMYDEVVDADVIITHLCPIPASLIEKGKKLRAILTNRGGLENIAVKAATERNIPILNNPAHNGNAVLKADPLMGCCVLYIIGIIHNCFLHILLLFFHFKFPFIGLLIKYL